MFKATCISKYPTFCTYIAGYLKQSSLVPWTLMLL